LYDVLRRIEERHGSAGALMTEERKISHTFRRLTMIAQAFGDADYHLTRFAASG
jgi:hypothetical protein